MFNIDTILLFYINKNINYTKNLLLFWEYK